MKTIVGKALGIENLTIGLAVVVVILTFSVINPAFFTLSNLVGVAIQSMFILLIGVGMTFVMTSGGIDLSVGGVLGASAGVTMFILTGGYGLVLALLAGALVGVLFGLVNGLLITRLQLSDFIVTLGTMSVGHGMLKIITFYQPLGNGGGNNALALLSNGSVYGVPVPVIISVGVIGVMAFVLRRTGYGRRVRAAGTSSNAATLAGINVRRVQFSVYVMCSVFASVSGILLVARLGAVSPGLGTGYALQAIAAAVLGGAILGGGKGSVLGTALAALFLGSLKAGLQFASVDPVWYQVAVGASIILAVALQQWSSKFAASHAGASPPTTPATASEIGGRWAASYIKNVTPRDTQSGVRNGRSQSAKS